MEYKADYLIEVSWEVCHKIGGIHTVLSSKSKQMVEEYKDNYLLVGPDVWKETHSNPEFIENKNILRSWREFAERSGIKLRIGRWNIPGNPVVILVDFTPYIILKDQILTEFWDSYKLDSISGQWDYLEPALFGYAAAKMIENFYEYNISAQDKIVAHFNEWSCGTGILYIKEMLPQIATVFTTHGNVLGKSLALDNKLVAFSNDKFDAEMLSYQYNVRSKYSLERISLEQSDIYTTVSDISNEESKILYNHSADVVTPNGFDISLANLDGDISILQKESRKKLKRIAQAVCKQTISEDALFVVTSGTHQIKNKGFDLFIDALAQYNNSNDSVRNIVAYIAVPAIVVGPREDITLDKDAEFDNPAIEDYLTHWIFDYDKNLIIERLQKSSLKNRPEDKVKVIFVPTYLNGNDGIVNMPYYKFLLGFDLSIFPSFYEPWGYTPMESATLGIPTLTTNRSGFGIWVKEHIGNDQKGIYILNRTSETYKKEVEDLKNFIVYHANVTTEEHHINSINAMELASGISWDKVIQHYFKAYHLSLVKSGERFHLYKQKISVRKPDNITLQKVDTEWRKILVKVNLPESLNPLSELSKNYWWSWNWNAIELFESIDSMLWKTCQQNPIALLETLSYERFLDLEKDENFLQRLNEVYKSFKTYMQASNTKENGMVAYFSMEFGIHDSLKIYSGGLGILAGDYLKEASDSNKHMIGIGLLYRYGYFKQEISNTGEQINQYIPQKFSQLPLIPVRNEFGEWQKISIALPGRTLSAKVWRVDVGRIPLFLLDTDFEDNNEIDRSITHNLYGGDWENRLKQEMLLGIGGIRMIKSMGMNPSIYHCNEGHAAFIGLERLKNLMQENNISFNQAVEIVRSSSLFTTHTPVPAGHDYFSEDLLRAYMSHYPERMNITWETLMNLGKIHDNDVNEKFSMSVLATKLSQEVNGVSKIHGRVSREMFKDLYKGYFPEELHIGFVTNGVHYPTWAHKYCQELHYETFGNDFLKHQSDPVIWEKIYDVSDKKIWDIRLKLKSEMINYIKIRIANDMTRRQENPRLIFNTLNALNENALTIGFARRFATYKRAKLLFSNLEKLSKLLNDPEKPIQLIYAGKAHPHDKAGQDLIKYIIEVSRMDAFLGKVIFIENYDIPLAQKLISGCDVWLNTPTRPLEASGTSGEKAVMNGVLNFSVLDGWWAEGYVPGAGWALKEERTYQNQDFQDVLDSETIYDKLKEEIAPIYYQFNDKKLPDLWIQYIKKNWAEIAPRFTMKRQLDDYYDRFYNILFERSKDISEDSYALAANLTKWKNRVINAWEQIEIIDIAVPISEQKPMLLGEYFNTSVTLNIANLSPDDIGVEIIFAQKINDKVEKIYKKFDLKQTKFDDGKLTFEAQIPAINAGVYDFIFRLYPKNDMLPHRQDFGLVRWF